MALPDASRDIFGTSEMELRSLFGQQCITSRGFGGTLRNYWKTSGAELHVGGAVGRGWRAVGRGVLQLGL